MVHTVTFDGKQEPGRASGDFIRGFGVRFTVPMRDASYDRHIRIGGEGTGLLREAVGASPACAATPARPCRQAQFAEEKLPNPATSGPAGDHPPKYIPEWGDYTLSQLSADGFTLRKRTKKGHGWIGAGGGRRASGFGYVGGVSGGLSFGLRDFWEKHPAQLDIRAAHTDEAEVTLWLWSPEAQPMDLRFYPTAWARTPSPSSSKASTSPTRTTNRSSAPPGIARTSELLFWANAATPSAEELAEQVGAVRVLPQLAALPEQLIKAEAFGPGPLRPARPLHPAKAKIEDHLDFLFTHYKDQVEQRRWYGFWDYGDIMHTYDAARHQWRYDIGGYAWDNSELSPDLWLWYAYLRSGRADIFRFAEAMTRHTGEVDVYHLGKWAKLGTRHGVQHYADSAEQQRIANTTYRRFYYFLTADERVGDLMHANVDSDETFLALDPLRKIRTEPYTPDRNALSIGFGTDWSGLVSAWLTEWERKGPKWEKARDRVLSTMETIAARPTASSRAAACTTWTPGGSPWPTPQGVEVSHLSGRLRPERTVRRTDRPRRHAAVRGGVLRLLPLLQREQVRTGRALRRELRQPLILFQGHSRLDAYAAGPDRRREARHARLGEVLRLRRLQGVGALDDGEAERPPRHWCRAARRAGCPPTTPPSTASPPSRTSHSWGTGCRSPP